MQRETLEDIYIHELKDLYSAEKQLIRALPEMAKAAENPQLAAAFQEYLEQTKEHAVCIEKILNEHRQSIRGPKCRGMEGLIAEGAEMVAEETDPEVKDAGLISAAQRVEHYEIASYGSARTYAEMLGDREGAKLLQRALEEVERADHKLTDLRLHQANKIAGKLSSPLPAKEFNAMDVARFCEPAGGVQYRLHSTNDKTGKPWPAVFFSRRGTSRFDPANGVGTLYVAESLAGAVLEIFDDRWGPVSSKERTFTRSELESWWVTLIDLPPTKVFQTKGSNLSKIGTDVQLLSGDHTAAREWALRLMKHPYSIEGIVYASRHDYTKLNLAVFCRDALLPAMFDEKLAVERISAWQRETDHGTGIIFGPAVMLGTHPELDAVVQELEVGLP